MRKYSIEKTAGIILLNENNNKVLLIKSNEGHWGYPKGHREKEDNNVYDNAIREVREEVGIKLNNSDLIQSFKETMYQYFFRRNSKKPLERKNGWIKKEIVFFAAMINEKTKIKIQKSELLSYKWMTYKAAENALIKEDIKKHGKVGSIVKKYLIILNEAKKISNN
jgi:tRNA nucleotidyltransferase (CCA-adding enzyme)